MCIYVCCTCGCTYLGIRAQPHCWLDLGHGAVQPHLCQATGVSCPNPVLPVAASMATWLLCQRCPEPGPPSPMGPPGEGGFLHHLLPRHYSWGFPRPSLPDGSFESFWTQLNAEFWSVPCGLLRPVSARASQRCFPSAAQTWLFSRSALGYGPAYVISVSFKSTGDSSRNWVQRRTAFSCR